MTRAAHASRPLAATRLTRRCGVAGRRTSVAVKGTVARWLKHCSSYLLHA